MLADEPLGLSALCRFALFFVVVRLLLFCCNWRTGIATTRFDDMSFPLSSRHVFSSVATSALHAEFSLRCSSFAGLLSSGSVTFVLGFGVRLANASASGHRCFGVASLLTPSDCLHASAFPEQFDYCFLIDLFISLASFILDA